MTTSSDKKRQFDCWSFICRVEDKTLFVPSEGMHAVHKQGTQASIAARAGFHTGTWVKFKTRHPEMMRWIYRMCHCRARCNCFLPDGAIPTDAMVAARKEASMDAIARAAGVSLRAVRSWLEEHKDYVWFEGWLLRGETAPANVIVLGPKEARRYSGAWDYIRFCKRARLAYGATYLRWLKEKLTPGLAWRKFLFGAPCPAGAFIVPPKLEQLRKESSETSILRAANLDQPTLRWWRKDPIKDKALQEAVTAANTSGRTKQNPWSEKTAMLSPRTKGNMRAFAEAQTFAARLERAELSRSHFESLYRQAKSCGVREELDKYLSYQEPHGPYGSARSGLVAENFFVLSPAMRDFREVASGHGLTWTTDFPELFDHWFAEWTTPRARYGQRVGELRDELAPVALANTLPSANGTSQSLDPASGVQESRPEPPRVENGGTAIAPRRPASMPSTQANEQKRKNLNATQHEFLDCLYDLKAFSSEMRATVKEIAERTDRIASTMGRVGSNLKARGLVDACEGSGGGFWLLSQGKRTVEKARKS